MAASMRSRTVSECSEESGLNDGELLQELGLLEAIYVNELNVITNESGVPSELSVVLHPATAGNVDQQYVCLTLHLKLPDQYPSRLPVISIRNSRGVSDEHLASLDVKLNQLAGERQGGAMLYELIEVAKESLTNNNTPSCQCVICLHGFTEADVFTKTQCYHYFHSQCLARYIKHAQESEEEPVCAVCREPVAFDLSQLVDAPPPSSDHEVYCPSKVIRDMQRKMAALYRRQKEKGGIIDIEAENNKYLINISQTPTLPANVGISPVMPLLRTQLSAVSVNDIKSDKGTASRSEAKTGSGGAEPNKPSDKKDTTSIKGNHSDQLRSSSRNDGRQGRRPWGRGRGSRGRGQSRPDSSGGRDNYMPASGFERNLEAKGLSSKDEGAEITNHADQSQAKIHKRVGIDQSKDRIQRDREKKVLDDDGRNDGHRPGSGNRRRDRPPQGTKKTLKVHVGDPGGHSEEKSVKPHKDITHPHGNQAAQQKSGDSKQEKSSKSMKGTNETARDLPSAIDKEKLERSKENNLISQDCISKGTGEDSQGPSHSGSIPKTDARQALNRDSKMNRKKSPGYSDRSCEVQTSAHADKQLTDSAVNSTPEASQERARRRPRQRNRYWQGEPSQSKDTSHSDAGGRVRDGLSEVKVAESDYRRPKSRHHNPPTGSSKSTEPNSSHKPAPAPNRPIRNNQVDMGQKSIRPPPGFEHVVL